MVSSGEKTVNILLVTKMIIKLNDYTYNASKNERLCKAV